ncbi:hypothetical protein RHSIM_Rhsim06G0193000 [Rhododendron simsii]|uniref:DUF4408 domain-containing protein n=1 Tax=Rhododendron simsii TaxID=118357 RepID=A0A834GX19_RHOSS|nr:hypothetical protein RHSIM_Rhsim06G0193000 [Rhododendron simsii]
MAIPKLSLRAVLISTSVLFAAVILKHSVPTIIQFASSEVVLTWLRPPYLYLIINCIIITIVASSKLQNNKVVEDSPHEAVVVLPAPVKVEAGFAAVYDGVDGKSDTVEVPPVFGYGYGEVVVKGEDFDVGGEVHGGMGEVESDKTTTLDLYAAEDVSGQDEVAVSTSLSSPQVNSATEYLVSSYERPPVSGRIGHRKGGRTLGVSKPKRHETLENTWKTITEGRPMPLARHLRKSDTWETHNRAGHLQEEVHDKMMIKSETFNDRSTASPADRPPVKLRREPSGSGKLKKESSPSQDELNRRVEAFIKKFNDEMRLQRQESLNNESGSPTRSPPPSSRRRRSRTCFPTPFPASKFSAQRDPGNAARLVCHGVFRSELGSGSWCFGGSRALLVFGWQISPFGSGVVMWLAIVDCACKEVWLAVGCLVIYRARSFEVLAGTHSGASLCGCKGFVPYAVKANISHLRTVLMVLSSGLLIYRC